MHDEEPFWRDLPGRRRTRVKSLGQQSEMTIDDTWPQTGEMRNLWKGTAEFWTNDTPQDTWEANRHHSHILPLFRGHLTVTSTQHGCRDSHLPVVPHTENSEEEGGHLPAVLHTENDEEEG